MWQQAGPPGLRATLGSADYEDKAKAFTLP